MYKRQHGGGIDLIVAVGPAALLDQLLLALLEGFQKREIRMCEMPLLLALRGPDPAVENRPLRRTPRALPLEPLEVKLLIGGNLVHRIDVPVGVLAVDDRHDLFVLDIERTVAALDDAHARDLGRLAVLHVVDRLGIAVHVVAVDLIVAEPRRHLLARHLVVMDQMCIRDSSMSMRRSPSFPRR